MRIKPIALILVLAMALSLLVGCGGGGIPVSKVTITGQGVTNGALTMLAASKVTLAAAVSPSDAKDKTVVWKSSNAAVVMISQAGELTSLTVGNAEITATAGGKSATVTVTVVQSKDATGVAFAQADVQVNVGGSVQLTVDVTPADATDRSVVYSIASLDGAVDGKATVDANGKVDVINGAVGGTKYEVTAALQKNPEIKATCTVTVQEIPVTGLAIRKGNEALALQSSPDDRIPIAIDTPKDAYFFVPQFTPDNSSQTDVVYASSDSSILSISQHAYFATYNVGPSAKIGSAVDLTLTGENGVSTTLYLKIGPANNYVVDELTAKYLNTLGIDRRTAWNIEKYATDGEGAGPEDDLYDTAGNLPLSQGIWRGRKSDSTYGGVAPWDGVWGVIFDSWDQLYVDDELPNQYMYNRIAVGSTINFIEFRVRSQLTSSPTSDRGKFRIRLVEPDGKGGYKAPVVLTKTKGIGTEDSNGWIVISNTTVADYEAARDYFYFDLSAYKGKTVVILLEVDDMHDAGLAPGAMDSALCDRICWLGSELQETMKDRTKE